MTVSFEIEPFTPHPLLSNPHLQTLAGNLYRHKDNVRYRRLRLDTPDGDFVDVDFVDVRGYGFGWETMPDDAPIVLVLHGLEGDARRGYMASMYEQVAQAGMRPVGMNFRSCSGEMNRTGTLYHMGATDDLMLVQDYLHTHYPDAPIFLVGFSLGANIVLKHLGQIRDTMPYVKGAVAVSPPFDLRGDHALDRGLGRIYQRHLLSKLQRKVRLKAPELQAWGGDVYGALTARTLREFDDAITAPLHGFADAEDYYARSGSRHYIHDICVQTLVLRALDDPFFNMDIPYEVFERNPALHAGFVAHGGHVGFIEGLTAFDYSDWAQRQARRFFTVVTPKRMH